MRDAAPVSPEPPHCTHQTSSGNRRPTPAVVGSVAKWQCCPLREATSAALPYTRRAGFWVVHESTRPVGPRSTQPQPPSPQKELYSGRGLKLKRLASDATSPRFQSMWPLLSARVCEVVCPWAPMKGPLHIIHYALCHDARGFPSRRVVVQICALVLERHQI